MAWIDDTRRTATGEKRYKVHYHAPDGKSHSKKFKRSEDARQFARDVENAKRQGDYLDPSRGRKTIRQFWPVFMQSSPHLRPTTRALYEGLARNHLLPVLGDYRLGRLTPADVSGFIATLQRRGAGAATINAAFRLLRTVLAAAETEGYLVRNPAARTGGKSRIKLPAVSASEMRFLEPEEVHRLAATISPRYRALVYVLGFCGPRVGEALALRTSDLELLHRRLSIARTLTELNGELLFGEPKTKGSRRSLALPAFVCDEIAAHLVTFPPGSEDLVFSAARGGPVRLNYFRKQVWMPAVRAAGLEPLRIHDLRHTAVAIAVKAGGHPKQIQAMCGHSSITITLDRYGHVFESAASELAGLVDVIAREASTTPGANAVPVSDLTVLAPHRRSVVTSGDGEIRTLEGAQHPLTA